MRIDRKKVILCLLGGTTIGIGYYLLGVPPDFNPDEVVARVRMGLFAVWAGAIIVVIGILR